MDPLECVGNVYMGVVKSYSPSKGYGFVTCDKLQGDLFFMHKNLPYDIVDRCREGSDFYLSGSEIAFTCDMSPEGKPTATIKVTLGSSGGKKGGGKGKGKGKGKGSGKSSYGGGDDYWGGEEEYWPSSKGQGKSSSKGGKKPSAAPAKKRSSGGMDPQAPGTPMLDGERVQGTIKSFSNGSKWGFALVDASVGDFGDIFVHYNNLDASLDDQEITLRDADVIEFRLEDVKGKPVARDVTLVEQDASLYDHQWMRGTIKTYNDAQGRGAITSLRIWGDILFQKSEMPRFLVADAVGTQVLFKLVVGPDGKPKGKMVNIVGSTDKFENVERLQQVVKSLKEDGYVDDEAAKTLGQTPCDELFSLLPDLEFYKAENPSSFILGALSRVRKEAEKGGGGKGGKSSSYRERPSYGKGGYDSSWDWGYDYGYDKGSWDKGGYGKSGGGKGKSGGKGKGYGRAAPY